ncbi:MBL fold metallo-hydrolase [Pedococcus sp. KACC 23699]|uniref:MBL fold metallo-hydrolase n=1 Tax=Pedococcus sp. KACC 23699 TaxID=3149228 RepID=A0AAU7JS70_9MICO
MSTVLTFLGAAGTVTGSRTLVEHSGTRTLVDCGLYQGERQWRRLNWQPFPVRAASIDGVVLTHAHLDHCGYLPALVRQGFEGPVWCTTGTADLAPIVLRDSAHLLEEEASYARTSGYSKHDPPLPLYTSGDVERAVHLLHETVYGGPVVLGGDGSLVLVRAGHVLGSASAHLTTADTTVLFSGDLGRPEHPVLRPREPAPAARNVVVESTYGDRSHPPLDPEHHILAEAIRRTVDRGGSVVIPAFAVDRTELVLHALSGLWREGRIPQVPVYVDSPMALRVLDVYRDQRHRSELRESAGADLVRLPGLRTLPSAQESQRINRPKEPSVIVSSSGMASGGRVVHHLRALLPDPRNTVVLTGYQAVGTRGRALADGAHEVKIAGAYVRVRAQVIQDQGFSVHADADELVRWVSGLAEPPESVFVTHGEPEAASALAARLREVTGATVVVPRLGERVIVP